jgi:glutathione S-transferase
MSQVEMSLPGTLKLYYSPNSPYVRKVMMTAHEVGVGERIERQPTDVWDSNAAVTAANPLGQIPTLVCVDGEVLYDSSVICGYLDDVYGGGRMLPRNGMARWRVLRNQALGDGLLNSAVIRVMEIRRRPHSLRWEDLLKRQQMIAHRVYDALEREAASFGEILDHGQVAIACALAYVDFRLAEDSWRKGRPRLAAWFGAVAARPSFTSTAPPAPVAVKEQQS